MDKYLLQILLQTKTIIIPGLGALTITNEETGEIMFMSYLKYDDGELVKHIVEKDGFTENEAKNLIAKYVSEINTRLSKGNDYEMFQFGKFFMKDGEIEFENWRASTEQDATRMVNNPAEVEEIKDAQEEGYIPENLVEVEVAELVITDVEPTEIHEADKSLDEILKETEEVEDEDLSIEEKEAEVTTFVETDISRENSYTPLEETVVVEDIIEAPEEEKIIIAVEPESVIEAETTTAPKIIVVKKKRKPIFWILIFLILLLLGISLATFFFYDQVKKYLPFMESQRTEVERNKGNAEDISEDLNESAEVYENGGKIENNSTDGTVVEEPGIEEKVVEIESKPVEPVKEVTPVVKTNLPSGKHYFVIVGAFAENNNADRYAEKLNAAGNQASIIGQYDGLHLVAIDAYDSESEAEQALSKFSAVTSKAWVFHKR